MLIATVVFPIALRVAKKHNIVDNPEARKLQKEPIPVFGGVAVVIGMITPLLVGSCMYPQINLWYPMLAIVALFLLGVTDDVKGLSAVLRFVLELVIVWILIWHPFQSDNGPIIDNFQGLFGRHTISLFTALPLTLIAGVGIVNAVNMIDGVDGYSSGYGIATNTLFSLLFYSFGNLEMALFSGVAAAALVPFYLHNVFGKKSKMFIGDGGSLVIGLVMATDVFTLLSSETNNGNLEMKGVGAVALALAILCIPVFDTLRVMCARIINRRNPFSADMTHLHHVYIRLGFSHVGTSTSIILTNLLIVGLWWLSWRLGASITLQFFIVAALGLLATCGFYYGSEYAISRQNGFYRLMNRIGRWTHFEEKGVWLFLQNVVDKF